MPRNKFPSEVAAQLKWYVYRLIDPRDGETFYVGKGQDDRVFDHANAVIKSEDMQDKIQRINGIRLAGLDVLHVIHRHGMEEKMALEVEAALIDAYPGLTNQVNGHGSGDFGVAHPEDLVRRYGAKEAVFSHKALLIKVGRSANELDLYEATRYAWRLDDKKAEKADVVLAVHQGLIVGAFIADRWLEATAQNFPGRPGEPGRYGFEGWPAKKALWNEYVGKRIPDKYRNRGASNPCRYTY